MALLWPRSFSSSVTNICQLSLHCKFPMGIFLFIVTFSCAPSVVSDPSHSQPGDADHRAAHTRCRRHSEDPGPHGTEPGLWPEPVQLLQHAPSCPTTRDRCRIHLLLSSTLGGNYTTVRKRKPLTSVT